VARILQDNGAALLAVHGRTKAQAYGGLADWDAIAEVVQAVSIPVLGNGDVQTAADIDRLKAHTGCAGVMVGRAAVGNPWIFARLEREQVPLEQVHSTLYAHLERNLDFFGAPLGLLRFRKNADRYLKPYGLPPDLRRSLLTATEVEAFKSLVEQAFAFAACPASRRWRL
jgi:tRNA-dihydrouridine synthase